MDSPLMSIRYEVGRGCGYGVQLRQKFIEPIYEISYRILVALGLEASGPTPSALTPCSIIRRYHKMECFGWDREDYTLFFLKCIDRVFRRCDED